MKSMDALQNERDKLRQEIGENLDFLMGSISAKGPKRPGLNLTFKIHQVTRTRHIRKEQETRVKQMTARWLRLLLKRISDVNWACLNQGIEG